MATFKPIVFTSGKNIKSDGTANIKIRVYHNKDSQYISTDYYIEPSFLGSDGSINPLHPGADLFNYELGETIQKYRKAGLKLGSERSSKMSCSEYRDFIVQSVKPDYDYIDFVQFCNDLIETEKKEKTAEWYQQSLNSYLWFVDKKKIDARDITRHKIIDWIEQLKKQGQKGNPLSPGTISNYVRGLRALFNECKKKHNKPDLDIIRIPNDPFTIDEIPKYKKKRKNITVESVKAIRDFQCKLKRPSMARDIFMMMFYLMGINIGDLYRIDEPVSGRLNYERSKTDTDDNEMFMLSIKIEPELQILIDKYSSKGFLSEIKKYSSVNELIKATNKGLKHICNDLKIPKITTNWARHSWASIARNKAKVPKADVDFCLGHVNNDYKMADIYIEIDYSICDDANRKVLDLLLDA